MVPEGNAGKATETAEPTPAPRKPITRITVIRDHGSLYWSLCSALGLGPGDISPTAIVIDWLGMTPLYGGPEVDQTTVPWRVS